MSGCLMWTKRRAECVLLVALLAVLSACTTRRSDPDDIIPDDAIVTVAVDWSQARDPRIAAIVGSMPPNVAEWGMHDASIRRVTMFARLGKGQSLRPSLILEGNDLGRNVAGRRSAAESGEKRGPFASFRHPSRDEAALVLSRNLVVVGAPGDLDAVVGRVASGRRVAGRRLAELQSLRPAARTPAVTLTVVWPDEVRLAVEDAVELSSGLMGLFGWEPLGSLVSRLGIGRAMLATVSTTQDGLSLHLNARLSNEATSRSIAAGLSALRSLSRFAGIQASGAGLQDLDVSAVGPILSVRTFIPNDALPNLSR